MDWAAQPSRQPMTAPALPALPSHVSSTTDTGVVIRVFHPFARTEFEPSEEVAQALRAGFRGAERVEIRGHTDSNVDNPIDRLIAIERKAICPHGISSSVNNPTSSDSSPARKSRSSRRAR